MPTIYRQKSDTGYYHIIIKGHNSENIFCDDEDRLRFISTLQRFRREFGFGLAAYCLMSNHAHLLIYDEKYKQDKFMKSIMVSYVYYFNKKHSRKGNLCDNRYFSKPVADEDYMKNVVRYIHMNSADIGIAPQRYRWSSYRQYISPDDTIDNRELLGIIGSFTDLMLNRPESYSEEEILTLKKPAKEKASADTAEELSGYTRASRNKTIKELYTRGMTVSRIAEQMKLTRPTVYAVIGDEK